MIHGNATDDNVEFSNEQLTRIDEVENAVYQLCKVLTEDDSLEWNMSYIGEIADLAAGILTEQGHKVRYPAIVEDSETGEHIEEYFS